MTQTEQLYHAIRSADKILLGAGAGLSAAAGLSYLDSAVFAEYFPELWQEGYRCEYELVGRRDNEWTLGRKWAYWATHVNYVRNIFPAAKLYAQLKQLLEGKDYFVVTSNADRQFMRAGFPMERLFEFQGNYDNMGCSAGCTPHTWPGMPHLLRVLDNIDHDTFECRDEAIPRCPYCGKPADMCFRPENYAEGRDRYTDFVESAADCRLCIIEIGVGFNTPGVIRWPFERITYYCPKSSFFRINSGYKERLGDGGYPRIPVEIMDRSVSVNMDAKQVIEALCRMDGIL